MRAMCTFAFLCSLYCMPLPGFALTHIHIALMMYVLYNNNIIREGEHVALMGAKSYLMRFGIYLAIAKKLHHLFLPLFFWTSTNWTMYEQALLSIHSCCTLYKLTFYRLMLYSGKFEGFRDVTLTCAKGTKDVNFEFWSEMFENDRKIERKTLPSSFFK